MKRMKIDQQRSICTMRTQSLLGRPARGWQLLMLCSLMAAMIRKAGALSSNKSPTHHNANQFRQVHRSEFVPSHLFLRHPMSSADIKLRNAPFRASPNRIFDTTLLNTNTKSQEGAASNDSKRRLIREMVAEFLGTFLIVQLGTGAVMSAVFTGAFGIFQIATVFSIAVMLAICATGSISGAHLNPAISIAFALLRSFQWGKVVPYTLAQLAGAVMGSWLNYIMYSGSIKSFEAAHGIIRLSEASLASAKAFGEYFTSPITVSVALFAEVLGTGVLAFIIFALTNEKNETTKGIFVPPLIGITVGALICVVAPLTQAGFNPARDFGPRIVAYFAGYRTVAFKSWWVYVLGPILGAVAGAALADKVLYSGD